MFKSKSGTELDVLLSYWQMDMYYQQTLLQLPTFQNVWHAYMPEEKYPLRARGVMYTVGVLNEVYFCRQLVMLHISS